MWNGLPYTVFDTGTQDGSKGVVNHWLLPLVVLSSVSVAQVLVGFAKAIYKPLCLSHWACAACFNNNNNKNYTPHICM